MKRNSGDSIDPDPATFSQETVRLQTVFLHVTMACNLRCKYCYLSASKPMPNELTAAEYSTLWPDVVRIRPAKVVLTGGEPLMRPDILTLLRTLRDSDTAHHILRCLNTNGHLVTREIASSLVGLADEVRVSIDGLEKRNDRLRGIGNFDSAMQALHCFHSVGFEPKILVTVTAYSLPDLEHLLVHLVSEGFKRINIRPFRAIGRGAQHPEFSVKPREIDIAVRRAANMCFPGRAQPDLARNHPLNNNNLHCGAGSFLNITPEGDVFPCHALTFRDFRCGNVREQRLEDICRNAGILGQLQKVDVAKMAFEEERLRPLLRSSICLGEAFRETRSLRVWGLHLSILSQG